MRTHGAASAAGFEALRNYLRLEKGLWLWGSFLIAAAALKTPTRNGYNAQGVNLTVHSSGRKEARATAQHLGR